MRLLDRSAGDFYDLQRLGFDEPHAGADEAFSPACRTACFWSPADGSGKSTTLYSALKRINLPDKKIITIEESGGVSNGRESTRSTSTRRSA